MDWRRTGTAQISVIGHTDTSGSSGHNQRLSERRADAVQAALIEEGVPAGSIVTLGRGQEDLLVPTADGVRRAGEPPRRNCGSAAASGSGTGGRGHGPTASAFAP